MVDPFHDISQLLKNAAPPLPNRIKENQAIDHALAKFDQKNTYASQGNGMWLRLMDTARTMLPPNKGVFMKKIYVVTGGLCAAMLVIALLNTSMLNNEFISFKKASTKLRAK